MLACFGDPPITLYLTHWFTWLTGSPSSSLAQLVKATTRFPVSKRGNAEDTKLHSSSDGMNIAIDNIYKSITEDIKETLLVTSKVITTGDGRQSKI